MYQADEKRYETMQYNRCGKSGLLLPKVSLGLWHNFGSNGDYDNMKAMCRTAFRLKSIRPTSEKQCVFWSTDATARISLPEPKAADSCACRAMTA